MRIHRRDLTLLLFALVVLLVACGPPPAGNQDVEETEPTALPAPETAEREEADEVAEGEAAEQTAPVASAATTTIDVAPGTEEVGPNGLPVGYTTAGFAFRGDPTAPVVMEEFSDFQCPFCSRFFEQTLPSLEENQIADGEVVLVYYDFPLKRIHPQAETAHIAAYCAGEEGAAAYWTMHDTLFANLNEWSNQGNAAEIFTGYAEALGLEVEEFSTCLAEERYRDQVQKGLDLGLAQGVNSTPSFFLNEQPLTGAQPLSTFDAAIATLLEGGSVAAAQPAQPEPSAPVALPTPATLSDDVAAAKGDPDAPVTIVEFTDYECPYCARYVEQTMPALMEEYVESGQVYYQLKDFPLDEPHPQARTAAAAARCAGEQDAYWEMHDELFATQPVWKEEVGTAPFEELARDLDLDVAAFTECLDSERYDEAIEANLAEGASLGVRGTPSFFINGFPIPGAQPLEIFDYAIGLAREGELAQAYAPRPTPTPRPNTPVEVPIGDAPSIGDQDAPVTIVEYTDYQCPYCSRHFNQTFSRIVENMVETGQVRYVFKDFPLTNIHFQATDAAEAARCARDQEAFLEMHDLLFERQTAWANQENAGEIFVTFAEDLDLDTETFAECLESNRYEADVLAEMQEGAELGVTGTPAFFINGRLLSGAQPYEAFVQMVEQAAAE